MSSAKPSVSRHAFGLVETTVIVIAIGVTALFAIPRIEARSEAPLVEQAAAYCRFIAAHQAARYRKGLEFSGHAPELSQYLDEERQPPDEFVVKKLTAEGKRHWRLILERRETTSAFGNYTIVWDNRGFNDRLSTVPSVLLPDQLR